jgi:hypothetical protein
MSLFNNSSRQLRRITEQYLDVENVSEHLKNHPAPVILAIKSKTYHGQYEKYTTIKDI